MISFYPGPSRVYDQIPDYVSDACKKGIVSINHRSAEFMKISEKTISLLKNRLNIPESYTVLYTTSATECWEIIAQSLITKKSYHVYNGAFGQKWFEYTKRLCSGAKSFPFQVNELANPNKISAEDDSIICITQNETSNGTQVDSRTIRAIKEKNPGCLVAVDATSSMAGIELDFHAADIWFASVQKCFGLPAGLGLMVCSPEAIEKVNGIGERSHYNSLTFMLEMMARWQTPFTPNVLNIYLLMRVLKNAPHINEVHKKTVKRYRQWLDFFSDRESIKHLVPNEEAHSYTVIPVTSNEEIISSVKSKAKKKGILLGEGYGDLKSSTFRIANFPAIKKSEIKALKDFLKNYR